MNRLQRAWQALVGEKSKPKAGRDSYKASEMNRLLSDWVFTALPADDELRHSMKRTRERARDLDRNSAIVKQYLRMVAINVVGPDGFKCQPQVRNASGDLDRATNAALLEAWTAWCKSATTDGRMDFNSFQRLSIRGLARDGECLIRKWRGFEDNPHRFAIEAIDPDQLDEQLNHLRGAGGNEVRLGVEVNRYGRPVAYHVWDRPGRFVSTVERERLRIPAEDIEHVYDLERANQTRGMSWLTPIMVPVHMLEGYREAEVIAARIGAAKMGFFERKDGELGVTTPEKETGRLEVEATPGSFLVLPDGYTATAWSADHPNAGFGAFVKDCIRHIAVGLGVSYNSLNSDLEAVNYSSMRSGLLIERDVWRLLQRWWIERAVEPIYREWLASYALSVAAGAIEAALPTYDLEALSPVRFSPRGWPWVDPTKDTDAAIKAIGAGLGSRQMALAEQGVDYETVLEDLSEEAALAEEFGVKLGGGAPAGPAPPPGEEDGEGDESQDDEQETDEEEEEGGARAVRAAVLAALRNGH